jgi:hypothetical protein
MSFFEWLGESSNPGPVGTTNFGSRTRGRQRRFMVLLRAFFSLMMIGVVFWIFFEILENRDPASYLYLSLGLGLYCLIAYFIHPEPDASNVEPVPKAVIF